MPGVPKSFAPERWFDWSNLTLACDICNTNKGNFVGDHNTFVDPYSMDPRDHLQFWGPLIFPRAGSEAGSITEKILDLNRGRLVEKRKERLENLLKHVEVIKRTASKELQKILAMNFRQETTDGREFAALSRYVLKSLEGEFPDLFSDTPNQPMA